MLRTGALSCGNLGLGLKERLYSATGGRLGARALHALARRIVVPELGAMKSAHRKPLLVVITVDTEAGFVARDERRVWQGEAPDAFQGFTHGVANLADVLARYQSRATFFVAPHFLAAPVRARERSLAALSRAREGGSEFGLHLHPASDRALAERLGRTFTETSGRYLSQTDKDELVSAGKAMLQESLATDVTSFRWGNWGLDAGGARALVKAGFAVDSSAVPGIRDRKARGPARPRYDWSETHHVGPWRMSLQNPVLEDASSPLLELPIATFELFGARLRADPLYGKLLEGAFVRYHERAPREDAPFAFVVMTHSSEATHEDGSPTRTLRDLESFLALATQTPGVELVTIREAARRVTED